MEPGLDTTGATIVDARALAVAPGFIDMHSHADFTLPAYPAAINSLSQGVTTEVTGNCGWSPGPLSLHPHHRSQWQHVGTALGPDLEWDWSTFGDYLDALDSASAAVNTAPLVGHSAIRAAAFGIDDRPPSADELNTMRSLLDEALVSGAWGMSTGLVYPPSSFADSSEVEALAEVLASADALYSTHMRDEGIDLAASVREAVSVANNTGCRVQISHLKAAGPASHGRIGEALTAIEASRAAGLRVGCDAYPYVAGSTVLTQLVPSWAMAGGVEELLARLRSDEMRRRIGDELRDSPHVYLNKLGGWAQVMIARVEEPSLRRFEGRRIPEIARAEGMSETEFLFDLLRDDMARTSMIVFLMDRRDVEVVLDHASTVYGSDQFGVHNPGSRVHPRAYGTFARVLARAVHRGEDALARAIAQSTGRTATRLGLNDRGFVRSGHVADLVVFDPREVRDNATYEDPTARASGIDTVLLGGRFAMVDGEIVNASLGRVLRRPSRRKGRHIG